MSKSHPWKLLDKTLPYFKGRVDESSAKVLHWGFICLEDQMDQIKALLKAYFKQGDKEKKYSIKKGIFKPASFLQVYGGSWWSTQGALQRVQQIFVICQDLCLLFELITSVYLLQLK